MPVPGILPLQLPEDHMYYSWIHPLHSMPGCEAIWHELVAQWESNIELTIRFVSTVSMLIQHVPPSDVGRTNIAQLVNVHALPLGGSTCWKRHIYMYSGTLPKMTSVFSSVTSHWGSDGIYGGKAHVAHVGKVACLRPQATGVSWARIPAVREFAYHPATKLGAQTEHAHALSAPMPHPNSVRSPACEALTSTKLQECCTWEPCHNLPETSTPKWQLTCILLWKDSALISHSSGGEICHPCLERPRQDESPIPHNEGKRLPSDAKLVWCRCSIENGSIWPDTTSVSPVPTWVCCYSLGVKIQRLNIEKESPVVRQWDGVIPQREAHQ